MFKYGMRSRGFSLGCQPMRGLVKRLDDTSGKYHDILLYDRPLKSAELDVYELDFISIYFPKKEEFNITEFSEFGYTTYDARLVAIDEAAQVFIDEVGFSEYVAEQAARRMMDDGLSFDEAVAIYSR